MRNYGLIQNGGEIRFVGYFHRLVFQRDVYPQLFIYRLAARIISVIMTYDIVTG